MKFCKFQTPFKKIIFNTRFSERDIFAFIKNIESIKKSAQLIKADKKTSTHIAKISKTKCVIKTYPRTGFWYLLTHCLQKTRASKSLRNAKYLDKNSIKTPMPILVFEKRFLFLKFKSYIVCEYVSGEQLADIFANNSSDSDLKIKTAKLMRELMNKFAAAKIYHSDMKDDNFIIKNKEIYVLDLDGMRVIKHNNFPKLHAEDKKRFLQNWQNHEFNFK